MSGIQMDPLVSLCDKYTGSEFSCATHDTS